MQAPAYASGLGFDVLIDVQAVLPGHAGMDICIRAWYLSVWMYRQYRLAMQAFTCTSGLGLDTFIDVQAVLPGKKTLGHATRLL